jgi:hypothetical protein
MTSFEFVFSLIVILLGLGLGQILTGLARVVKRKRVRLGWGTGLLAFWIICETIVFWRIIWRTRDVLPGTTAALYAGFIITGCYYFAAAVVLPDDIDERTRLDEYFMAEKGKAIGAVLAGIGISLILRPLVMGVESWSDLTWWDWVALAAIYTAGPIAMVTRRPGLAIGCLAVLAALDALEPIASVVSGSA